MHLSKNLCFALLILITTTSSMCSKDEEDTPNQNYTSLIGLWKVKSGTTYAINDKNEQIVTATIKEGVVGHEFLSDGSYIGHDYTGTTPGEKGNWELKITLLDGQDIEDGTLAISSPSIKQSAGDLFVDADGYIRYSIATIDQPIGGSKSVMTLTTKKYEAFPYNENWAVFVFIKN